MAVSRNDRSPPLRDSSVVRDAQWFPEDYVRADDSLSFVHVECDTIARQTFLDRRWDRDGLARARLSLRAVDGVIGDDTPPPKLHFIWHTSFCCSTLLARTLDLPGKNVALREPMILATVADVKRSGAMARNKMTARLPEFAFRLLARMPDPDAAVTVKPSNFANILVGDAARHTQGQSLFLYSDLPSFLASVAKSSLQLRKYARRLFMGIAGDAQQQMPWQPHELFQMSDLEIAAIAWHMQIAEFRKCWKDFGGGRAASLDCDAFLADPASALEVLDGFFGTGLGRDHLRAVAQGPLFTQHAKNPQLAFSAQDRYAQNESTRRALGDDLMRIVEWSYKACPGTPRGAPPLPDPLMAIDKTY